MESVTRWVVTHINKDGARTLSCPMQGRHTWETRELAQAWLDAVRKNTDADTLVQLYGNPDAMEVRPCPCWPGHFDPQTCWFD